MSQVRIIVVREADIVKVWAVTSHELIIIIAN